ncbi:MAG: hypothetical protein ACRDHN_04780 [Thermomicrobiales bacterium]
MSRVISGELYRTDRDGVILGNLSAAVKSGSIEYSADRSGGTALLGRFVLDRADALAPLQDFVSPFLVLKDELGHTTRTRLGIFRVSIPSEVHSPNQAEPSYELRDLTELLARGASKDPYVIAAGTTFVSALSAVAGLVGITRLALPNSSRVTGYKRTYPAGTSYLEIMNRLCEAVAWYPVWMGLDGKLTTKPQQKLSESTPIGTISSADPAEVGGGAPVVNVVATDPAAVANMVVVTRDRGDGDLLEAIRVNDDPASETSVPRIGPAIFGGGPYEASDAETQADVDAIADRLLDQCRSYERQVTLKVEPNPGWLGMWRTIELQIATAAGANLRGRYWISGWSQGFTPGEALTGFTLNRWVRFGRGEDR